MEEEQAFDNVDATANLKPWLYPYDPQDPNNAMVAELNALNGKVMGPSKVMSVKEGETIELSTNYWYTEGPSETPLYNLTEILAGVLLNLGTAGTGIIPSGAESALAALNNVGSPQFGNLHDFLDDAFQDIDLSEPQAYLVYMFFDKQDMNIVAKKSGVIQVAEANALGVLTKGDIVPDRDGFIYVYSTSRSERPVNFDNLEIRRWKPVVRTTYDYYAYGLTWENPSDSRSEEGLHDCTYQDKEFQFSEFSDGHGLALYDFHARLYDGATGRWSVPDPAAQFSNPYLAMGNNPVVGVDPDGRIVPILVGIMIGAALGGGMSAIQGVMQGKSGNALLAEVGMGMITGAIGGAVGAYPLVGTGIGFMQGFAAGMANGLVVGTATGAVGSLLRREDVLEGAVKGGLMGGLCGGISGGITGVKEVNKLNEANTGSGRYKGIDGAYVTSKSAFSPIKDGLQDGDFNCIPKACEAVDNSLGGSMTESYIRGKMGGDPTKNPLFDVPTVELMTTEGGYTLTMPDAVRQMGSKSWVNGSYDDDIATFQSRMMNGERIMINLKVPGSDVGHMVVMRSVSVKSVIRQNGNFRCHYSFTVMNPGTGGSTYPTYDDIMKANNIFFIRK